VRLRSLFDRNTWIIGASFAAALGATAIGTIAFSGGFNDKPAIVKEHRASTDESTVPEETTTSVTVELGTPLRVEGTTTTAPHPVVAPQVTTTTTAVVVVEPPAPTPSTTTTTEPDNTEFCREHPESTHCPQPATTTSTTAP
jgi:hypothetical protein